MNELMLPNDTVSRQKLDPADTADNEELAEKGETLKYFKEEMWHCGRETTGRAAFFSVFMTTVEPSVNEKDLI